MKCSCPKLSNDLAQNGTSMQSKFQSFETDAFTSTTVDMKDFDLKLVERRFDNLNEPSKSKSNVSAFVFLSLARGRFGCLVGWLTLYMMTLRFMTYDIKWHPNCMCYYTRTRPLYAR